MVSCMRAGAYLVHVTEIVPENESAKVYCINRQDSQQRGSKEKARWRILFWKHTTLPAIWTN